MKITPKKAGIIGAVLTVVGVLTLFINRLYTANCVMPCGYFDDTRDVVIKIGAGILVVGVFILVYGVIRVVVDTGKARE